MRRPTLRTYFAGLPADDRRDILAEVVDALDQGTLDAALDALDGVAPHLVERVVREHRRDSGAVQAPPPPSPTVAAEGYTVSYAPSAALPAGFTIEAMTEALLGAHVVGGSELDKSDRVSLRCAGQLRHVGAIAQVRGCELLVISIDARRHRFRS